MKHIYMYIYNTIIFKSLHTFVVSLHVFNSCLYSFHICTHLGLGTLTSLARCDVTWLDNDGLS